MLRTEGNLELKETCSDGYIIFVVDYASLNEISWIRYFCNILASQQVTNKHPPHPFHKAALRIQN